MSDPDPTPTEQAAKERKPFNDHTPVGKWFCKVNYPMYGSMGAFKIEVPEEPFGLVIAERGPFDARSDEMKANAEFIVHACNTYYDTQTLVARLRSLVGELASNLRQSDDTLKLEMDWGGHSDLRKANAAALLRAKAEGFNHEEQKA